MSAADDVLSFEEQLRRLIEQAVESAEQANDVTNRYAYVLGYVMGPVQFTPEERRALDRRIYGAAPSAGSGSAE